jgi:hypothetical protein
MRLPSWTLPHCGSGGCPGGDRGQNPAPERLAHRESTRVGDVAATYEEPATDGPPPRAEGTRDRGESEALSSEVRR